MIFIEIMQAESGKGGLNYHFKTEMFLPEGVNVLKRGE